jgi:hypothetical protein
MVERLPGVARAILFTHRKPSGLIDWFDTNMDALNYANSEALFSRERHQNIHIITVMADKEGDFLCILMAEQLWWRRDRSSYHSSSEWMNQDDIAAWAELVRGNWSDIKALDGFIE